MALTKGICGSALFSQHLKHPEIINVRMGIFDGDLGLRPWVACTSPDPPFGSQCPTSVCPALPDLSKRIRSTSTPLAAGDHNDAYDSPPSVASAVERLWLPRRCLIVRVVELIWSGIAARAVTSGCSQQ